MTMPKLARLGAGAAIALVALGGGWAWAHDEGAGASQTIRLLIRAVNAHDR